MSKPSIPRGTRDFGPKIMAKRKYILNTIEQVYQSFGFMPLETPSMENLSTLTGKYGAEGDQLLFKILDSGDYYGKFKSSSNYRDLFLSSLNYLIKRIFAEFDESTSINDSEKIAEYIDKNSSNIVLYPASNLNYQELEFVKHFFIKKRHEISTLLVYFFKKTHLTKEKYSKNEEALLKMLDENLLNETLIPDLILTQVGSREITSEISEKGLRYDLTVPLARYVVMNQNEVTFPFKRYQMQPVWRADRPQKGRYREFWQCDADVLGTPSLLCEADFIKIYRQVFAKLKLTGYEIRINHRKLLEAVVEKADASSHFKTITIIIDKADKIGIDGVKNELINLGLKENQTDIILSLLNKQAFTAENLEKIKNELPDTEHARKAMGDLNQLLSLIDHQTDFVYLDGSLARGLDYYTGCIFEVVPTDVQMGSISGGGRYDDLTGIFGLKGISGIGISFGIDRIYDVMEELNLFPADGTKFTDVLFCCMDEKAFAYCLPLADDLRLNGIKTEVYPDTSKLKKQLDYANAKNISWAVIVGENEMNHHQLTIKNLVSGEQQLIDKNALTLFLERL